MGAAKAETGSNSMVAAPARAVRRVTTGATRAALEAGGVEFTNGDRPGVNLSENRRVNPRQANAVYWTKVGQALPVIR